MEFSIFQISNCISHDVETSDPENVSILNLPVELLLDIFDKLDLKNVMSVAKSHAHNRAVVDVMVKRLISNRTFEIDSCGRGTCSYKIHGKMSFAKRVDCQIILDLFEYFGHHITKLIVNFDNFANHTGREVVHEHIRKHAAEWLEEVFFIFHRLSKKFIDLFTDMDAPFTRAKVVRLEHGGLICWEANLTKIFPVGKFHNWKNDEN